MTMGLTMDLPVLSNLTAPAIPDNPFGENRVDWPLETFEQYEIQSNGWTDWTENKPEPRSGPDLARWVGQAFWGMQRTYRDKEDKTHQPTWSAATRLKTERRISQCLEVARRRAQGRVQKSAVALGFGFILALAWFPALLDASSDVGSWLQLVGCVLLVGGLNLAVHGRPRARERDAIFPAQTTAGIAFVATSLAAFVIVTLVVFGSPRCGTDGAVGGPGVRGGRSRESAAFGQVGRGPDREAHGRHPSRARGGPRDGAMAVAVRPQACRRR
jgi:hypothetical protein